jgi:hypothetical protein
MERKALASPHALSPLWRHLLSASLLALVLASTILFPEDMNGFKPIGIALTIVMVLLFINYAAESRVTVGSDGVRTRWFGMQRFVPWDQVRSIAQSHRLWFGVGLGLRSYNTVDLALANDETFSVAVDSERDATTFSQEMHKRLGAHRRSQLGAEVGTLERGDRSHQEWIAHLRSVGDGSIGSHRTAAPTPERLLALASSSALPDALRVGAAVAAIGGTRDRERTRIREVASSLASPKLRIALERAADPATSDAMLAEELAELEQAEALAREER